MKAPDNFITNLKNGNVTDEMISECAHYADTMARVYGDKARWYCGKNRKTALHFRDGYYELKDYLLNLVKPSYVEAVECKGKKRYFVYYKVGKHEFHRPMYYENGKYKFGNVSGSRYCWTKTFSDAKECAEFIMKNIYWKTNEIINAEYRSLFCKMTGLPTI